MTHHLEQYPLINSHVEGSGSLSFMIETQAHKGHGSNPSRMCDRRERRLHNDFLSGLNPDPLPHLKSLRINT